MGAGSHHNERLAAHREALGKPDSQLKKDGWKQAQAMGKGLVAAWQQQLGVQKAPDNAVHSRQCFHHPC